MTGDVVQPGEGSPGALPPGSAPAGPSPPGPQSWPAPPPYGPPAAFPNPTLPGYPPGPAGALAAGGYPLSPDGRWVWSGAAWLPTGISPYRSPRGRATAAQAGLALAIGAALLYIVAYARRISILNDIESGNTPPSSDIMSSDDLVRAGGQILLAAALITAVPFLMWLHRCVANLGSLGGRQQQFSRGWAVGWWFIPVANFFMPVRAVSEAWRASDPRVGATNQSTRRSVPLGALVPAWWAMWLVSGFVSLGTITDDQATLERFKQAAQIGIVTGVLRILAALLAILVVRQLTVRQETKARAVGEGRLSI